MPDPIAAASTTLETIRRFNEAFARGDVDGMMAVMTEDCVFENTRPAPDGDRHVGAAAVRAFWEAFFARGLKTRFDVEEIFADGERCTMRWVYHWVRDGQPGQVRGVDVFRIRDGKIAEKLSYVKG